MTLKKLDKYGFRLLTEYHSFLFAEGHAYAMVRYYQGFRLLTEYHSFLFLKKIQYQKIFS